AAARARSRAGSAADRHDLWHVPALPQRTLRAAPVLGTARRLCRVLDGGECVAPAAGRFSAWLALLPRERGRLHGLSLLARLDPARAPTDQVGDLWLRHVLDRLSGLLAAHLHAPPQYRLYAVGLSGVSAPAVRGADHLLPRHPTLSSLRHRHHHPPHAGLR